MALTDYWGPIFRKKPWDEDAARPYLHRFLPRADDIHLPPPSRAMLRAAMRGAQHSAPGPDALPYAAWQAHPFAEE
eukprot:1718749-Pyramimonas_sp.AAC.1